MVSAGHNGLMLDGGKRDQVTWGEAAGRGRGFTLIELLVVISILVLLIALLLPSLSNAKETGRRIVCGSQIRQLFVGSSFYANDFQNILPYRYAFLPQAWGDSTTTDTSPNAAAQGMGKGGAVQLYKAQYVNDDTHRTMICPSKSSPCRYGVNIWWDSPNAYGAGTAANSSICFPGGSSWIYDPSASLSNRYYWVRLDLHDNAQIMFDDCVVDETLPIGVGPWVQQNNHFSGTSPLGDGGNAAFTDGHTEWISTDSRRWISLPGQTTSQLTVAGAYPVEYGASDASFGTSADHLYLFASSDLSKPLRGKVY